MSDAKHTPGPWQTSSKIPLVIADRGIVEPTIFVCQCDDLRLDMAVNLANARLIAEAPAMLDELKRVARLIGETDCGGPQYVAARERMLAIISRIEDGTP